ncbi:MAG TPA: hypothetical protein VNC16_09505 [Solirubrobacterales bacterium]|nr:hypothetical protein [Solirubrobacterales bacterium]
MKLNSLRKLILAVVAALAAMALPATAAQACSYSGAEQVFQPWGDTSHYVLAPDGGFEAGGLGWYLGGGAKAVEGNESFFLNDAADSKSLALPAGSSAVSPPICMSIDTPHFRLLARNTGDPASYLKVEATYLLLGLIRTKTVGTVKAGSTWAPTQQLSTVLTLSTVVGTLIPSAIQIRITPVGSGGNWQVDDVYIDPFARH